MLILIVFGFKKADAYNTSFLGSDMYVSFIFVIFQTVPVMFIVASSTSATLMSRLIFCLCLDFPNSRSFHSVNRSSPRHPKAVADPGFSPGGGRQLPKVLLFFNFLPKTAWKWKNLDPQGGRASLAPPLGSANGKSQQYVATCIIQIINITYQLWNRMLALSNFCDGTIARS